MSSFLFGSSRTLGRFAATATLVAAAALSCPAAAQAAAPGAAPSAASAWTYLATYPSYNDCYLASLSVGDWVSTQCRVISGGRAELWVNG
ncbi:hypothetical protein [Streptomyces qinzhouensis]|uniref:Uncharacterized protein n=1 Tax=Streptomyces qinzhouensis TaxID=2599401 RepID=A0A5B8JPE9_9ACTN|nr:hypothetical protein [Streptomyces qinzhouensis]QDY79543.1 hypothetical protein FQU76_26835 [Streptomyces qinzhouensis]